MNFEKKNYHTIRITMYIFVLPVMSCRFLKILLKEDISESVYQESWNNNDIYHPFGTVKRSLGYNNQISRLYLAKDHTYIDEYKKV